MSEERNEKFKDLLKKAFALSDVQEDTFLEGFFAGKTAKYTIPEASLQATVKEFPFLKNALKSGLLAKDKKSGNYFTTKTILSVRSNDKRKRRKRQFFSISGDDAHERTTLYDGLVTIANLRYISAKFGVSSDELKFTIRHENGNPARVVNYVEMDKYLFGNNDEEIESNIQSLNNLVKYERRNTTETASV